MKLYTKTGDGGETSLADGTRVPKDHARVAACGDLDELIAVLGWCRCSTGPPAVLSGIKKIQQKLFLLGAELAMPSGSGRSKRPPVVSSDECRRLEAWIDDAVGAVEPLGNFLVCGGTELACRLHFARACCRRAERAVTTLARSGDVRGEVTAYLNRLSDLLFAWARQVNHEAGAADDIWVSKA